MLPRFDYGDPVRVIRTVRNDGTYPGLNRGALLVRRGCVGYVRQRGTFLQDRIVYAVHFPELDGRIVGCREEELIPADAPWVPARFEFRDRVSNRPALALGGRIVVRAGSEGEVVKVLYGEPVMYHVRFGARTLQVAEDALLPLGPP